MISQYQVSSDTTDISIAQVSNNEPTYYLLKKKRNALSGAVKSQTFSFDEPEEFPTVVLEDTNVAGILDCIDSQGNQWFEVDYLGTGTNIYKFKKYKCK